MKTVMGGNCCPSWIQTLAFEGISSPCWFIVGCKQFYFCSEIQCRIVLEKFGRAFGFKVAPNSTSSWRVYSHSLFPEMYGNVPPVYKSSVISSLLKGCSGVPSSLRLSFSPLYGHNLSLCSLLFVLSYNLTLRMKWFFVLAKSMVEPSTVVGLQIWRF